jgi:hypothetical protein
MRLAKTQTTSPVRMRPADKKYVGKLARQTNISQAEILHRAVELLKREHQFEGMRETYISLSKTELAKMQKESRLLDKASGDGME